MGRADKRTSRPASEISPEELARFLRDLAGLYKNTQTGNPALSAALLRLASSLPPRNKSLRGAHDASRPHAPSFEKQDFASVSRLRSLDPRAVERFLADENKTKAELIELAAARFSIPRSKLTKLKMPEVRETIRAALLHENSLKIIMQEAQRGGARRSS